MNQNLLHIVCCMLFVCLASAATTAENTTVDKPWARETAEGQRVAAIFCSLNNPGAKADKLLRVESTAATTVEVHEHITTKDGLMKMQAVANGIEIPSKGTVTLKPGSYHVMLIGLTNRLTKGSTVKATFVFEKAGSIAVEATVLEAGAMSADDGTTDKKTAK